MLNFLEYELSEIISFGAKFDPISHCENRERLAGSRGRQ